MIYRFAIAAALTTLALNTAIAKGGVGSITGAVIGSGTSRAVGRNLTPEESLAHEVAEVNKRLPHIINSTTRIESVEAGPELTLTYHYTLTKVSGTEMNRKEFAKKAPAALAKDVCAAPSARKQLSSGITLRYAYNSYDGKPLGTIQFKPGDCK